MHATVITPPAALLTREQAKKHLRVEDTDDDAYIDALITAAQATIDGPQGWLGRAVGEQTLEVNSGGFYPLGDAPRLCANWAGAIRLPCPPVLEIVEVAYRDANGAEQVIDGDVYFVDHGEVLRPTQGFSWPTTSLAHDAVRVRYQAGYETVPASILHAVKIIVGLLYENRTSSIDVQSHPTVASLLAPYRLMRV